MTAPMTAERLAEHEEVLLYASWPMGEEQHDAVVEAAREALAEVRRFRGIRDKRPRVVYVPVSCGCRGCDGGLT